MPVERTLIAPPRSRIGAITVEERAAVRSRSPVGARYDTRVNRESAHEILAKRVATATAEAAPASKQAPKDQTQSGGKLNEWLWGTGRRQGMAETMAKQAARTVGGQLGRQILRGVLGGLAGGSRRR
jgi:hypothetical protein